MLPLATHCHNHYHLRPFHFVLFLGSKFWLLSNIQHTHTHTRRYMLRNSMGACTTTIVRMARNARGRGRGFYPVPFSGSPRFVYPTSPVRATSFYPSPPYYDATKSSPVPEVNRGCEGCGVRVCLGRGVRGVSSQVAKQQACEGKA